MTCTDADARAQVRRLFNQADESPVTVMAGPADSVSEGVLISSLEARWMNLVVADLRTTFGLNYGGFGYRPAYYVYMTSNWTPAGDVTFASVFGIPWLNGPGYRSASIQPGGTMTGSVTGTTARVWHPVGDGLGVMSVRIDGVLQPLINQDNDVVSVHDTHTDYALTPGPHTFVFGHSSGPSVGFCGVQVFDGDELSGFRMIDASHSGANVDLYAAYGATDGPTYGADLADWSSQANIAIPLIGVNNWSAGTTTATFKTYYQTIVDSLQDGNADLVTVIVAMYEADVAHSVPWSDYVTAMREIAEDTPMTSFLDLSAVMPVAGTTEGDASGFYVDGLHPTDLGHAEIASHISDHLYDLYDLSEDCYFPRRTAEHQNEPTDPLAVPRPAWAS